MTAGWFEVDKEGLAKLLARKGKEFMIFELAQNAWDEMGVTRVDIQLEMLPNRPAAKLIVSDDCPEGFKYLEHAYTLFAESTKKSNPSQRGRFNLGEKLVLACCNEAKISTTKGNVTFLADGTRKVGYKKQDAGSIFEAEVKITRAEFDEVCKEVWKLIPPENIVTTFNGQEIPGRKWIASFEVTLPTEIADEEGRIKRTARKTTVQVFQPKKGETPSIYEMGIPVVETGDTFHINLTLYSR